jgi:hypothetical protein
LGSQTVVVLVDGLKQFSSRSVVGIKYSIIAGLQLTGITATVEHVRAAGWNWAALVLIGA